MATKLTAEQKLHRAHVWIMRQREFIGYSGVIMAGDVRIEPDPEKCPTAYTDGYNVVYGEKFIDSLPEEQVRWVALHENIHKMYRHTSMWRHLWKQSPILTNIAADYVVNGIIAQARCPQVQPWPQQVYDKDLSDGTKDVGEVFRILVKKYPQLANPQCVGIGQGTPQKGNGKGSGQMPAGFPQQFDEHDFEKANEWSQQEEQEIAQKIDAAIRQGAILAGKVAGDQARDFGDLLKVKIDYKEILRQFFNDTCVDEGELSYRRPHRRFLHMDEIHPTEICETLPEVVIGIDTSGSIGGEILTRFMSNVVAMLRQVNPQKVYLLYWDTRVAGAETYEAGEVDKMLASTKPAGGGGTSPQCVSDWLKKNKVNPTCLVMLTDGYVDGWPKGIECPTIWCFYENAQANPPYGTIAHI